jgi:hypothetical protein
MATLKISDLSVGDWVRYRDREWQVCSIYQFTGEVGLLRKDSQICESIEDIEPIPITPEILEANGFQHNKKVFADTWCWTNEKDTMIEVGMFKDNAYLRIVQLVDGHQQDSRLSVKHVHQLQRSLHLAGVEKEINL